MSKKIHEGSHITPIDRVAERVIREGDHFITDKKPTSIVHQKTPLPIRKRLKDFCLKGGEDLTDRTVGRLTVIGLYNPFGKERSKTDKERGGRWVVRCTCGSFELRRAKAIKNPANSNDCCYECRYLEKLKEKDRYRRNLS